MPENDPAKGLHWVEFDLDAVTNRRWERLVIEEFKDSLAKHAEFQRLFPDDV